MFCRSHPMVRPCSYVEQLTVIQLRIELNSLLQSMQVYRRYLWAWFLNY
jgi:hypothetical protein